MKKCLNVRISHEFSISNGLTNYIKVSIMSFILVDQQQSEYIDAQFVLIFVGKEFAGVVHKSDYGGRGEYL